MAGLSSKFKLKKNSKTQKTSIERLRWFNFMLAGLFALQAVLIAFFADSNKGDVPITTNFLTEDKLASNAAGESIFVQGSTLLYDLNLAYLLAGALLVFGLYHLLVSTVMRVKYKDYLNKGFNPARWIAYGLGLGMIVLAVSFLAGVQDLASLGAIFGLVVLANLGRMQAEKNQSQKALQTCRGYKLSLKAGTINLFILVVYVWAAGVYGGGLETYVYFVVVTAVLAFALTNFILRSRLKNRGRFNDYNYTEWAYMVSSLIATSAIAWQIFAGYLT